MSKLTVNNLLANGYVWNPLTRSYEREERKLEQPAQSRSRINQQSVRVGGNTKPSSSPLEDKFLALWTHLNGPDLQRQAELIPSRKFVCDFFHEPSRVVIEVNGFKDHTSAKGFHRDNEKHALLFAHGYTVITLDRHIITPSFLPQVIDEVKRRAT